MRPCFHGSGLFRWTRRRDTGGVLVSMPWEFFREISDEKRSFRSEPDAMSKRPWKDHGIDLIVMDYFAMLVDGIPGRRCEKHGRNA